MQGTLLRGLFFITLGLLSFSGIAQGPVADNAHPITFEIPDGLEEGVHFAKGRIYFKVKADQASALDQNSSLKTYLESIQAQFSKLFPQAQKPERETDAYGRKLADLTRVYVAEFSESIPVREVMNRIRLTGLVEYVHPNFFVNPESGNREQFIPNDPQLTNQWHINHIGVPAAWDVSTGSPSVIIGIPDGGTNFAHADLQNIHYNLSDPIDGVDNDGDGWVDNYQGWNTGSNNNNPQFNVGGGANHGVAVTGLAAATVNNATDGVGIGYQSPYLPVKIVNASNQWSGAEPGVFYAAEKGAKIINCSWGNTFPWPLMEDVTRYATINKGCMMVAAAGNGNTPNPFWPAAYEGVFCVAGIQPSDVKTPTSSYFELVDISSPGINMFTTSNGGFANVGSGTSWASPVVSGSAALVFSAFPTYTPEQVAAHIKETSFNHYSIPGNAAFIDRLGRGRIDIGNALNSSPGPSVYLVSRNWTDGNDNIFTPGESVSLSGNFINWLNASSPALSCTLSSASPFISITDSIFSPGIINNLQVVNNNAVPFTVTISPLCPPNTVINFRLTFNDGSYYDRQYFSLIVNPDYLNITENVLHTSVAGNGRLGFTDTDQAFGMGMSRNGALQHIRTASLILTDSPTRVSDATISATVSPFNTDFLMVNPPRETQPEIAQHESFTGFNDDNAGASKLNVKSHLRSYAWNTPGYDRFVILEYTLINQGPSGLSNLFSGIYNFYDIPNAQFYGGLHMALWDASRRMGFAYNAQNPVGTLAGVKLLSYDPVSWYAFNNDGAGGSINIFDGFSDAEKHTAISNGVSRPSSVFGNVSGLLGTGPLNIQSGDSIRVAFALVLGDNLTDLQNTADAAQEYYDLYFGTWTGNLTTDWHAGGNWLSGSVPASGANIIIPDVSSTSGNFPLISGSATVNNITIRPGASLIVNSGGDITVNRLLTNSGTITVENDGALVQTVTSQISGTGNFIVKRNLPTSDRFHYIGSPVNNSSVNGFGIIPSPVNGGNGSQLIPQPTCDPLALEAGSPWCNLLELRENASLIHNCSQSLWHIKSAGNLENGRGYAAMVYSGPTSLSFNGTINNGQIIFSNLGNTDPSATISDPVSGSISRGWHLVSNPYPSPISLGTGNNSLTAMGFDAQVQIWNAAANTWIPSVSNSVIPVAQGFQIRNSGAAALNFQTSNALRTATTNTFYSMPWEQFLTVSLENGSYSMPTVIFFHEEATDLYDGKLEANRLFGGADIPVIYSLTEDQEKMAFNGYQPLNGDYKSVVIGIYDGATPGAFTLNFQDLNTLENSTVKLEDIKLQSMHAVQEGFSYSFQTEPGDNRERFRLHFNLTETTGTENNSEALFNLYPNPSSDLFLVSVSSSDMNYSLTISDLSGKTHFKQHIPSGSQTIAINAEKLSAGMYIVSIQETSGTKRKQIQKLTIVKN